ncbi:RNA pyrophosphohydrolase [Kamptonema cortianum]|nr:RNA pyrophosphohydrolase [Oscillatoria laete-virens]MDK3160227.1 RNA pyrophosphohydrolase [Kamptonema cortianum]MDL5048419.1 RNA pyrophosphohydrolase [Oscillatoria amoena NRMC-F 0135]MDL5055669.1 RNA pyrophosphohydrolase [Oscillatoria laete-virens NRMC-F 0139]
MSDKSTTRKSGDKIRDGFRHNVAAVIRNRQGQILIAARVDYPDSWQFPQGGVDKGESEEEAVLREVMEETGITSARILAKSRELHSYAFTGKSPFKKSLGQRQRYFLIDFHGTDDEITLNNGKHREFCAWKWIEPENLPLHSVYKPRQSIYKAVMEEFFGIVISLPSSS